MRNLLLPIVSLAIASGCTPPEEKVRRVIDQAIEECKAAEGDFAEVKVIGGTDKVLKATCNEPVKDLKLTDEFHATAMVGPYTYIVGIDDEHGLWVLSQVDWEALADAQRALAGGDPPTDARERAEPRWATAQSEYPSSPWIRKQRFENLLELRKSKRNKDENRVALGDALDNYLKETTEWAQSPEQKALLVDLRLMVVDYQKAFADALESSFENLGGSDEHLEATIRQAEKDGDKESAQKYRETLEKERAERPAKIKRMQDEIVAARKAACAQLDLIDPNALEGDAKTAAVAAKGATKCTPDAFEPPNPAEFAVEEGE